MLKFARLSLILALFLLVSCGGDDDGPSDPGGDTNAPAVVSGSPDQDATGVGVDDAITVVFDEDMDEASADGNVALSSGTVTTTTWSDARTLAITHSNWAEGTNIEVTLGTGIKDLAGNGLAAPHVWDFWTMSSVPSLLRTIPEDGATNVALSVKVGLLFSEQMDLPSLRSSTRVDLVAPRAAPIFITIDQGEGDWIDLVFDSALPLSTPVTITVSTGAMTATGTNLPADEQFTFTTTGQSDTSPPNLLSVVPASGTLIRPSTSSIVFTFDEAIDDNRFVPSQLSGQLFVYLEASGVEPTWSVDGTVLTVNLPTPLPAGLPIVANFNSYFDLAGNEQTTPIEYRVDVQGDPDFWPFDAGNQFSYFEDWTEFEPGVGMSQGTDVLYYQFDPAGADMRWARYDDASFTTTNEWDTYRKTTSEVQFRGFYSNNGAEIEDVSLSPPVIWARLPFAIGSWAGSSTADAGMGTFPVDYDVEILAQEDLTAAFGIGSETEVIWFDCFKSIQTWDVGNGESTGTNTIWYAPGIGVVLSVSHEVDSGGRTWDSTEELVGRTFPN